MLAPVLPVARLLGEEDQPHRRAGGGEAALRRLRDAQEANLGRAGDDAEQQGRERRPRRDHGRRSARLAHEADDLGSIPRQRLLRRRRETCQRNASDPPDDHRRDELGDDDADDRLDHPVVDPDRDGGEPKALREGLVAPTEVVAAAQEKRRGTDVLGCLDEGQRCGREDREPDVVPAEERLAERSQGQQRQRGERRRR